MGYWGDMASWRFDHELNIENAHRPKICSQPFNNAS